MPHGTYWPSFTNRPSPKSTQALSSLDLEMKQFYHVDPTNNVVKFMHCSYTQVDTWKIGWSYIHGTSHYKKYS